MIYWSLIDLILVLWLIKNLFEIFLITIIMSIKSQIDIDILSNLKTFACKLDIT